MGARKWGTYEEVLARTIDRHRVGDFGRRYDEAFSRLAKVDGANRQGGRAIQ